MGERSGPGEDEAGNIGRSVVAPRLRTPTCASHEPGSVFWGICAPVPFGTGPLGGFNHCLFELKKPFAECLTDDARPTASRRCDEANPCRDDYACARVFVKPGSTGTDASDASPESGACMPPYFVFQGRVDGHVIPQ